ncbi:MAG: hypothetical protein ACT4OW_02695 [Nitrososphaerota archaeon]
MTQICANINNKILEEFRAVIYEKSGLKKGDFKKFLEDAMLEYVTKYTRNGIKNKR